MSFEIIGYHLANDREGLEVIKQNQHLLSKIIPTWLELGEDGSLKEKQTGQDLELISHLKKKFPVVPLVQNYKLDSSVSNKLVTDPAARENGVANLVLYLDIYRQSGINLDLEGIKIENKKDYLLFVEMIAAAFNNKGYRLGLSIPAKSKNNRDSTWSGAYDYHRLGEMAQEIIIMAYDYHWAGGTPGSIAPLSWVQDVIDFALLEIPLEKIYLGIPFYGYDWGVDSEKPARGLSYRGVKKIQSRYEAVIEWDQESSSPYMRYNRGDEQHEVWFENRKSLLKKIKLVKDYNLAGAAFWRLGLEDSSFWSELQQVVL